MKKTVISLILLLLIVGAFGFVVYERAAMSVPASTVMPTNTATPASAAPVNTAAPSGTPTPEPTPTPTPEPTPEYFTLTYIGDLTLTSHQYTTDYEKKMNGDYSYPLSNVAEYLQTDEYTIGNLECTFSDRKLYSIETFYFLAPTASTQILTEGGVDFVTTANNHTEDFGEQGKEDTWAALEEYGVPYGKNDEAQIVVTPNGLRLGIYCQFNRRYGDYRPDLDMALAAIEELKAADADYIICAFHWGIELHYRPEQSAVDIAHACIDAGADMIYGSHPHCLQPVEEYNGGLILYSMGNFSFGGNTTPSDMDTAIVQVTMKRDLDGTVTHEGYTLIPCCVSSRPVTEGYKRDGYNDYRPTPWEEGTEDYERALSKIDGTYEGANGEANYSNWHATHG